MAFAVNIKLFTPLARSIIANGPRTCLSRPLHSAALGSVGPFTRNSPLLSFQCNQTRQLGSGKPTFSRDLNDSHDDQPMSLSQVLETEIQEESAELSKSLSSDQFPGFSVETDNADVKLTKQVGLSTVVVRFTVSSSLTEWKSDDATEQPDSQDQQEGYNYSLLSMPEFQVQITRNGKTLEMSCYFEEMEQDDESGEAMQTDPVFQIDEIVMYNMEPRETEFAVSTEYFRDELQEGLLQFLAEHGIDDEFAKNLVSYSTNYEKKQYIGLMKRLKDFVSN